MTDSPNLRKDMSRTAKPSSVAPSVVRVLVVTALDTTWRLFTPLLLSVWAGIGLDHWLGSKPTATIVCLCIGTVLSAILIAKQLKRVKK